MPSPLEIRANAVAATIAEWHEKRAFGMPKNDCFKLFLFLLKQMGKNLPQSSKAIGYKSPLQARALMKKVYKVGSLHQLMDKYYQRITPAECLPGDIMATPGVDELKLGAIAIYVGNEQLFGYVEDFDTPQVGRLTFDEGAEPLAAWRVM